ncbi:outer membrane lipoprotein carrier protein LolA [Paracoccaceae bacterium]|nr:outer membrane lipoprotein carrier protein LolA [Paracoccaceae bacterium]
MKLISFLVSFSCIWCLGVIPALSEKFSLIELSDYFNRFNTFQANFRQFADDGSVANGILSIKKPGRLRIDYDKPEDLLILASGGQLAIFDPKGDPEPTAFPLIVTPLALILSKQLNLVDSSNILSHEYTQNETSLSLFDPEHPERGHIELIFSGNTPTLDRLVIHDESGSITVMIIEQYRENISLNEMQFNIQLEIERRRN